MPEIRLSTAEHIPKSDSFFGWLAKGFDPNPDTEVSVRSISWATLWSYLNEILDNPGKIDVSEVGTTWMGHFIDKRGLRPVSKEEIDALGGFESFHDSGWQSTRLLTEDQAFGVPWLADTRVIYYWRSHLEQAGIDEQDAFSTPEKMADTLKALSEAGRPAWGAPTFAVTNTLHQVASWIWSAGGDFVAEDGKGTLFCHPDSLEGICQYYKLYRYMPHGFDTLDQILDEFEDRKISVTINGSWFLMRLLLGGATEEIVADLGAALPPGLLCGGFQSRDMASYGSG